MGNKGMKLKKWTWYRRDPETWKRKMSETCKAKWANGGPRTGHYDTVKAKLEASKLMTLTMNRRLAERTKKTYASFKGEYGGARFPTVANTLPYRNELQRRAFESLDMNPLVQSFRYMGDAIEVSRPTHQRTKRQYKTFQIIDFLVTDKNGSKRLILLKPKGIDVRYMSALNEIQKYCADNNYLLEIWTNEQFSISESQPQLTP